MCILNADNANVLYCGTIYLITFALQCLRNLFFQKSSEFASNENEFSGAVFHSFRVQWGPCGDGGNSWQGGKT